MAKMYEQACVLQSQESGSLLYFTQSVWRHILGVGKWTGSIPGPRAYTWPGESKVWLNGMHGLSQCHQDT